MTTKIKISPHTFRSTDKQWLEKYPHLPACEVRFPNPITVADYKKWKESIPKDVGNSEIDVLDSSLLMGLYKGAFSIAKFHFIEDVADEETAVDDDSDDVEIINDAEPDYGEYTVPSSYDTPAFSLADIDPSNKQIDLTFVSWVVDVCADAMAEMLIVDVVSESPLQTVLERRMKSMHKEPGFQHDHASDLAPDMLRYKGYVVFYPHLTAFWYRKLDRSRRMLSNFPSQNVNNSLFIRQLRGAVALLKDAKFAEVDTNNKVNWKSWTDNDCANMPLFVASWLVECCDEYLFHRVSLGKLRPLSDNGQNNQTQRPRKPKSRRRK